MRILTLTLLLVFSLSFSGCDVNPSAAMNNRNAAITQPTINANADAKPAINVEAGEANTSLADDRDGNEITECVPQKVYRGETLKISFKKSHGKNLAIYNERTRDFYFLTENAPYYFPQMLPDEFEKHTFIELNTQKVRSASDKIGADGYNKSKPYFDRTGWYRVIIGHQGLDVDFIDMPVTGSCRIYYVNKKRSSGK